MSLSKCNLRSALGKIRENDLGGKIVGIRVTLHPSNVLQNRVAHPVLSIIFEKNQFGTHCSLSFKHDALRKTNLSASKMLRECINVRFGAPRRSI
jgi:hypothetical protein